MSKQYKLDIFEVIKQIDSGNMSYYDSLSEEQKKGFVPVVVHQWLLGHASPDRLDMLDALVNTQIFELHKRPELIYKLMVAASDGKQKRYKYLKQKNKKAPPAVSVQIIAKYYNIGFRDAKELLGVLSTQDIVDIAEELGEDQATIKKIKK